MKPEAFDVLNMPDPLRRPTGVPVRDPITGDWSFVDPMAGGGADKGPAGVSVEDAQRLLVQRREALGVRPNTPEEARAGAQWHATRQVQRRETLAEVLARGAGTALPVEDTCPPAGIARRPARGPLEDAEVRYDARVPDACTVCPARCPWTNGAHRCLRCGERLVPVTWTLLETLIGKRGRAALSGVETRDGRLLRGRAAVEELRRRMSAAPSIVLLGESRAGKTMAAAAWAEEEIIRGAERLVWASPKGLEDAGGIDRALGGKTIVLDDLGEELANACADSGLAAQRIVHVSDFVTRLARLRGKKLVVTTFQDRETVGKLYGGGIAARIYDGADTIRFAGRGGA